MKQDSSQIEIKGIAVSRKYDALVGTKDGYYLVDCVHNWDSLEGKQV